MRKSFLRVGVACVATMMCSPAMAGVDGYFTSTGGSLKVFDPPTVATYGTSSYGGATRAVAGGSSIMGSASVFSSTSSAENGLISFRNGNSTGGSYATASSYTSLRVDFTNDSAVPVQPLLNSTIFAAGMGWFIGSNNCLNNINACNPVDDAITTMTLQDFLPKQLEMNFVNLGGASFDFKILGSAGNIIYDVAGSFTLMRNVGTSQNVMVTNLAQAAQDLNNFRVSSNSASSWGVQWDATDIERSLGITLGPSDLLGTGDSASVFYESTVSTYSSSDCVNNACLFSYASFGDPIGRGGGVTNVTAFDDALRGFDAPETSLEGNFRSITPPEENPLSFPATQFALPTFEGGIIKILAVPEPSSWMLMIGGFAFLGGQLRTQRRRVTVGSV